MNKSQIAEKESERIFWVIQTVFGFIIARSFYAYGEVFLPGRSEGADIFTLTLALIAVYACVLWSWVDFSFTLIIRPYKFRNRPLEKWRFVVDLLIVLAYTYLLLFIDVFNKTPDEDMSYFLYAFAFVFAGYILSGILRKIEYGKRASRLTLIIIFFH